MVNVGEYLLSKMAKLLTILVLKFERLFDTLCVDVVKTLTAEWVKNCVDPDQTPHSTASDQVLHSLLKPACPNSKSKHRNQFWILILEAWREKTCLLTCALNEDSNQPAHPRSQDWVFVVRMKKTLHLCPSKIHPLKVLVRLRECAGSSESSLGAHVRRYIFWRWGSFLLIRLTFVVCLDFLINYRLESLCEKLKDWMSNSVDPDETAQWAVSSGSTLFAKAYYYRLWQWELTAAGDISTVLLLLLLLFKYNKEWHSRWFTWNAKPFKLIIIKKNVISYIFAFRFSLLLSLIFSSPELKAREVSLYDRLGPSSIVGRRSYFETSTSLRPVDQSYSSLRDGGLTAYWFEAGPSKTLVAMATESSYLLIMEKIMSPTFLGHFWSNLLQTCK